MRKRNLLFIFIIMFIPLFSFGQEPNFWPRQLGLQLNQVKQNISEEYKSTKIEEHSNSISVDKVILLQREASILAQSYNGQVFIIKISISSYPAEMFKELDTYFTSKHGKSKHSVNNDMYKEELANDNKVRFWDLKKYSIMISLSTFGLNIQYLDTGIYERRQESMLKQLTDEKNKF